MKRYFERLNVGFEFIVWFVFVIFGGGECGCFWSFFYEFVCLFEF